MPRMSEELQNIWKERIDYLENQGITIMSGDEYMAQIPKICKQTQWGFLFN
jgi:hypothetical protein